MLALTRRLNSSSSSSQRAMEGMPPFLPQFDTRVVPIVMRRFDKKTIVNLFAESLASWRERMSVRMDDMMTRVPIFNFVF